MSGFLAVLKREVLSLFVTPLAWIAISSFLLVQGIHFFWLVRHFSNQQQIAADGGPVQAFFGGTIFLYLPLLFICPLLTMRLFAEERRSGTIEALMTAPVGSAGIVLAKYAASLVAYTSMWAPTVLYMVFVSKTGDIDTRVMGSSYLAIFLVGAGYLAVGTMTSAFSKSQVVAAVLSAMALIALFLIGIGEFIFLDGPVREVCSYVSVWTQMGEFSQGIIDLRRLVWNGTVILLPLFVTVRAVDAWRWG
ncbi:MAG: ABC transporter permease subunit [Polyangiaceae bacterium]|nr:ABC transporter permease subunit [Polyangiaceae bacterium]